MIVVLVGMIVAVQLALPAVAHAAIPFVSPFDCKQPPVPQSPGTGVTSVFVGPPAHLPPADDPFAPGAKTTVYQQYGFAGLHWNTYDLGCGPAETRDPSAVVYNGLANFIMSLPLTMVAVSLALLDKIFAASWLGTFDPLLRNVTAALGKHWFLLWFPLALTCVGLFLLWRARQADYAETARHTGWALVVLAAVAFVLGWPVQAGGMFDRVVIGSIGTANSALAGGSSTASATDAVGSNLYDSVLYRIWLRGEFGSASSATAHAYGPQLLQASALTWREARTVQDDPNGAGKTIVAAKQQQFKAVAAKVQAVDPDAYEHLTGHRADDRAGYAVLALIFALACCLFFVFAGLLVVLALLVMRVAVMLLPLIAPAAAFPTLRASFIDKALNVVGGAVYNAVVFGAAVGAYSATVGFLSASGLPDWLAVVILGVITVLFWRLTRPMRRLLDVIPGRHAARSAAGWALRQAIGYSATKHAVEEGLHDTEDQPRSTPARNAEETLAAPLADLRADAPPRFGSDAEPESGPNDDGPFTAAGAAADASAPGAPQPPRAHVTGRHAALGGVSGSGPQPEDQSRPSAGPAPSGSTTDPSSPEDAPYYQSTESLPPDSQPYRVEPEIIEGESVHRIYRRGETGDE
ncbi:MAG: hypothetical protein ABJA34_06415 [Pseudonocardiales bacterium]